MTYRNTIVPSTLLVYRKTFDGAVEFSDVLRVYNQMCKEHPECTLHELTAEESPYGDRSIQLAGYREETKEEALKKEKSRRNNVVKSVKAQAKRLGYKLVKENE